MGTCPDAIKRLIDRFTQQSDEIRSPDYKEHLIRVDFLDPLMNQLRWDVHNTAGLPLKSREVYPEDRVQIGGQTKAPDYSYPHMACCWSRCAVLATLLSRAYRLILAMQDIFACEIFGAKLCLLARSPRRAGVAI